MKISIITATWNSAGTLRYTFDSLLSQTYTDYEYIVVDGLSKDGTLDIIKEYEGKFCGKMRYISEKDKGLYDAMNKGLKMATGDVIGILNSDDFYTSNDILEVVARSIKENNVDAVYGDIHFVNSDDLTKCVRYYSSSIFSRWLMRFGFMPAHPSFYCKREIYEKYGAFNTKYRIAADFDSLFRFIYIKKISTLYIKRDFVTMRTGGISTNGFRSRWLIMKEHSKVMKSYGVYTNILFFGMRYPFKIYEILSSRVKNQFGRMR